MKRIGKDFGYIETKTPEQKAFNRRRFFQGRIDAAQSSREYFHDIGKERHRSGSIDYINATTGMIWRFHRTSALSLVEANHIVQCEAFGLRKATLS